MPILRKKNVIVVSWSKGESPGAYSPLEMTPEERQAMIARLSNALDKLMQKAQTTHLKHCYLEDSKEVDLNYITCLCTNEFFFYTKLPLTLEEFEHLLNIIAEKAQVMSPGIELILGSFAVKTNDKYLANITPHIISGSPPSIHLLVKNHTSDIDVVYKGKKEDGEFPLLPFFDLKIQIQRCL